MKQLVLQLQAHPTFAKVWHWVKLIAITGGAQAVVQATGLLSGILIIRLLPVEEYALYTLANTMLGTMTVLADGGISAGVMAEGGKVWHDREQLGLVLATGLDLRRKFALVSLLILIPILVYLLQVHGASWLMTILIVASLIPAFFAGLSDSLLQIVPKLYQEVVPLQKNQVAVSASRLLLTGLLIFLYPWSFIALLANAIPRIWGNFMLKKTVYSVVELYKYSDNRYKYEILKMVKKILPSSLYYCFSGNITIWIASIFSNTTSIAQISALGRIGMILNIFTVVFSTLVIPRFSKLISKSNVLLRYYFLVHFWLIGFFLVMIFVFAELSPYILGVLGKNYDKLEKELILSLIVSVLATMSGLSNGLYVSRGWVINAFTGIPLVLTIDILLIFFIDVSSTTGIITYSIIVNSIAFLINFFYGMYKIKTL
ncbi:lipopolysaccharide biosynthesis protein [Runella zeae]|uniref:lipopolysaccharide biosynthesis protein n=1 Tax=Runella zeae TaxID=94255 RepID=UPI00048F4073|nr:hypothetical protein [Runella zeae]